VLPKALLAQFLNPLEEIVVVLWVMVGEGEALYASHFGNLHGLIEATMSPAAPVL
jgi:hypothetical protein